MKIILVQMSDKAWTMQALHFACALARNYSAKLILLRLISVPHPSYLGTEFGNLPPTCQELEELDWYSATAEDYGVELALQNMQSVTALNAVADAAEQLDADFVFARIPQSWLPYWQQFQTWWLNRRLAAAHRQLFTLNSDRQEVPSITIKPVHISAGK